MGAYRVVEVKIDNKSCPAGLYRSIPVITVDGPSGAGKGTIAYSLARTLGWHLLDSGTIYRVLAFIARANALSLIQEQQLLPLLEQLSQLSFSINHSDSCLKIFWKQRDITRAIRNEALGRLASQVAKHVKIREGLLSYQRSFRKQPGLVADGRDMGTVIFPDAVLKIFLFAALEERARRRFLQLKAMGKHVSLGALYAQLEERDIQDRERTVSPLKMPEGALVIDTTCLQVQAVLEKIQAKLRLVLSNDQGGC